MWFAVNNNNSAAISQKVKIMDKKNVLGLLFFMGLMGVVVSGMVAFQPEKQVMSEQTAEYFMSGFPVLPAN